MLHELRAKNSVLLRRVTSSSTGAAAVLPERVAVESWEADLTPLTWRELQVVWHRVCKAYRDGDRRDGSDTFSLGAADAESDVALEAASEIHKLCDRGYLSHGEVWYGATEEIYPSSAVHLLLLKDTVRESAKALPVTTWDVHLREYCDSKKSN